MADNPEGEETAVAAHETAQEEHQQSDPAPVEPEAAEPAATATATPEQPEAVEAPPTEAPPVEETKIRKPSVKEEIVPPKEKKLEILDKAKGKGGKEGGEEDLIGLLQGFFGEGITTEEKTVKPIRRPKLIYFNTYRLESKKPFSSEKVSIVLKKTLEEMLEKTKYKATAASDLGIAIAEKIRSRVLALKFDRYKIVVHVTFGPLDRQGEHIGFRGFWDAKRDSYAYYTYKNASIYCNAIVCGFYFE